MTAAGRPASAARYLVLAYALLIINGSLHPFSGWRDPGVPLLDFLHGGWPRWYTWFDLAMNVAAYLPLGFLAVPALRPWLKPGWAALAAVALGWFLSLALEMAQNFLPARVPAFTDVLTNGIGAVLGAALGLAWGAVLADGGAFHRWRVRRLVRGRAGDIGFTLLAVWWLALLNPETVLFGTGDIRTLLDLPAPVTFTTERFVAVELAITVCGMLAAGLLAWNCMREHSPWSLAALFVIGLAVKTLSAALLVHGDAYFAWVTPGTRSGLLLGAALLAAALALPHALQQALAALALLCGVVLINLAPENPYLADTVRAWRAGHFLNFNGLTRLASALWPFVALPFLMWLPADRAPRRHVRRL